jgi:hypothetical protein
LTQKAWYENSKYKKGKKDIPQEESLEDKLSLLPCYQYLESQGKVFFKVVSPLGEEIRCLSKEKFFERLSHLEKFIRENHSEKSRQEQIKILYINMTIGSQSYKSEPFKNSEEYFDYLETKGYTLEYESGNVKAFMKRGHAEITDEKAEQPKTELEQFIEVRRGKKSQIPKPIEEEERDSWITRFGESVRDRLRHKKESN